MAEAETENQALDVEALTGILRGRATRQTFPLGPAILITTAERATIFAALERAGRLEAAFEDASKLYTELHNRYERLEKAARTVIEEMPPRASSLYALETTLTPASAEEGG